MSTLDKARENRLRRKARRLGLELRKSRARYIRVDDFGQYRLVNPHTNFIVAGERFDLSLDDVDDILNQWEEKLKLEAQKKRGGDIKN